MWTKKALSKALSEKRICSRCGWVITKTEWKKGVRLCPGCEDGLKGVNVSRGCEKLSEEPIDMTGEMI
jgi:hypothetical protein